MSAKHTPGPWMVKGRVHSSGEAVRIEGRSEMLDECAHELQAGEFTPIAAGTKRYRALISKHRRTV